VGIRLEHPYSAGDLPWLRGNLHAHTTGSDGQLSPQELIDAYAALGYDFLMISDHDVVTQLRNLDHQGLALITGNEITAYGPHLLHVHAHRCISPDKDRQRMIDAINADGGFCIVNHPNWTENFNHCPQDMLESWQDYAGIEIFNGVTVRAEGSPWADDRWDMLLSKGRRVWGFANDDAHRPADCGLAWNAVQCASRKPAHIVRALREGRFFASTGVQIKAIAVEGATVRIETEDAQRIRVVSSHGRVVETIDRATAEYTVPADFPWPYIRLQCFGFGDMQGFTQPFFIQRD
jgi:hypothetical protein